MSSSVAGTWAWYVWHVTWQASLVAICILAVARLGRRQSVQWVYGLLVIALLKFALLPAWSLTAGLFGWLAPAVEVPTGSGGWWCALASLPAVRWLMAVHVLGAAAVGGWLAWQLIRLGPPDPSLRDRGFGACRGPSGVHDAEDGDVPLGSSAGLS